MVEIKPKSRIPDGDGGPGGDGPGPFRHGKAVRLSGTWVQFLVSANGPSSAAERPTLGRMPRVTSPDVGNRQDGGSANAVWVGCLCTQPALKGYSCSSRGVREDR